MQEQDFHGTYDMVNDGKKGILKIEHNPGFDNDAVCSNLRINYTDSSNNKQYQGAGYTLTTTAGPNFCWAGGFWLSGDECAYTPSTRRQECTSLADEGADNKIVFYINFDQGKTRFDGYLFTLSKNALAGIAWGADGKPYGFYATKRLTLTPVGTMLGTPLISKKT